jgi:hypothetical protein
MPDTREMGCSDGDCGVCSVLNDWRMSIRLTTVRVPMTKITKRKSFFLDRGRRSPIVLAIGLGSRLRGVDFSPVRGSIQVWERNGWVCFRIDSRNK